MPLKNTSEWEWSSTEEAISIDYNFTPADAGVMYYADGSGEPPTPAHVDIVRFNFRGVDITELMDMMLTHNLLDELEMEIVEWEGDRHDVRVSQRH